MLPVPHRVEARRQELEDAVTLELRAEHEPGIVQCLPGQFNMLYAFGVGEIPISASGDPRAGRLVHTTRAVGRVSEAICKLQVGAMLGVRGPFGTSWPLEAMRGKDVVIVAGGIGLAPLRPAIFHVVHAMKDHGRVSIVIGARQPEHLLFTRDYDVWREAGAKVLVTVDTADNGWNGSVGVVTELIPQAEFDASKMVALVCGPEIMMRFAVQKLQRAGVNACDVFITMERNMKCAVGLCGHCQYGPDFICKDGPVFPLSRVEERFFVPEI